MAELLKRTEAIPASYPAAPEGLSTEAAALDSDMLWQRIESYIAHRWSERAVVWVVRGPGDWAPDLTPATISTVEQFINTAWTAVTLDVAWNGGYLLPGDAIYRFTGTAGVDSTQDVPAAVEEAFRRLAEYSAADPGTWGSSTFKAEVGPVAIEYDRAPTWLARAMQLSGAADLLRNYRRVVTC